MNTYADDAGARLIPRQGDALLIEHRFMGIAPDRISRVLRWREGRGHALSDPPEAANG